MDISFFAAAIVAGTPLLFATLGEIITEKSGNLNLGVEGMMLMGAVSGFAVGLWTKNPVLALMAAMGAGAIGGLIFAFLTVTLRANQVVTGLSLTIFGTGISNFMGKGFIGQIMSGDMKKLAATVRIPVLGNIPYIGDVLFNQDIFVYIGYVIAIVAGIYLFKTRKGLNLRAIGENPQAADAAGIAINRYKYIHIMIGGALCGLGGAYLSLVYVPTWQESITAGRGWIAIALVIFCTWNPYKALIGSYLFGGLDIIGFRIQSWNISISQNLIEMLPYLCTIIVLVVGSLKKSKENTTPKALGEAYFREER